MNGQMEGWLIRWMDGQMDRWIAGWTARQTERQSIRDVSMHLKS